MTFLPEASRPFAALGVIALAAACASGHGRASIDDRAAIASLQATVRVVSGETTWVTYGAGYELVGRTKHDLVALQPQLDHESSALRRAFGNDSLSHIVVTVLRMPGQGKPFVAAPLVPFSTTSPVVESMLADDSPRGDGEGERGRMGNFGAGTPLQPVVRAWLSARASMLTHTKALSTQASGRVDDPRVPAWADDAMNSLLADSLIERQTAELAAHQESLYPLPTFLTMSRPAFVPPANGQRGEGGGNSRGGSMGGGRGGRGGGGGSRGGRGGRGGGGERGQNGEQALQGEALFTAQAAVFSRYLIAREGYDFIGALVDAQILGKSADDVLAQRKSVSLTQMELDWPRWLASAAGKR